MAALVDMTFIGKFEVAIPLQYPTGHQVWYYPPRRWWSRRSEDLVLQIDPEGMSTWYGSFKPGYDQPPAITRVMTWPDPCKACVISRGGGFLVDVRTPGSGTEIECFPITAAIGLRGLRLVVFAGLTRLYGYREDGLAWVTDELSWEGIELSNADEDGIVGYGYDVEREARVRFVVDPASGQHEGGAGWAIP